VPQSTIFHNAPNILGPSVSIYPSEYATWISQAVPAALYHGARWHPTGVYTTTSSGTPDINASIAYGQYEPGYGLLRMAQHLGGNTGLETYADWACSGWRRFSTNNGGGVQGYYNYTDMFRLDWLINGDIVSRDALFDQSISASYTPDSTPIAWVENEGASREVAYATLGYINAELCGTGHNPKITPYITLMLADSGESVIYNGYTGLLGSGGHIEQWLGGLQTDSNGNVVAGTENLHRFNFGVNATETGISGVALVVSGITGVTYPQGYAPFMGAITSWALISAYENSGNISGGINLGDRIIPKIERLFDGMWPYYWIPQDNAMKYRWNSWAWTGVASGHVIAQTGGSTALNNEMAPIYWWLYKKTGKIRHLQRGDALFNGTVGYDSLYYTGGDVQVYHAKEFNELIRWAFDGLGWRTTGVRQYGGL
jgi:hypothetical protein